MIGVISEKSEQEIVREFFELFKTPWEFYQPDHAYDVAILTKDTTEEINAKVIIICGSQKRKLDYEIGILLGAKKENVVLQWNGFHLPIYRQLATLSGGSQVIARVEDTADRAVTALDKGGKRILRIGFDLFDEVLFLLSSGQPAQFAHIPTLEMHISMLRNWILGSGIALVEIPPVPAGCDLICCLTHDVDFAGVRNHRFDHTIFGFLYRALIGSLIKFLRQSISLDKLLKNYRSVLLLPGVYLGFVEDFWLQFDTYLQIENDLCSTFFFLPYEKRPGKAEFGQASGRREARYDVANLNRHIQRLMSNGCEIGLHGIEAWRDIEKGIEESDRISSVTGRSTSGVRIHWLFFNSQSPKVLEKAGFVYDSTLGYNDAVGYLAGTTQVFRPFGVEKLLELPVHIQDTALFYPKRMGLEENQAFDLCKTLIKNESIYGGVLVINWHQRSLAPERLWGEFYVRLLSYLKEHRVWFATAEQVVNWFQKRRDARFDGVGFTKRKARVKISGKGNDSGPELSLRLYKPTPEDFLDSVSLRTTREFVQVPIKYNSEIEIPLWPDC